uniref:ZP domain-containing protein n=1 Tax=Parastrongyloides trichosuri TaxID=131310 RepID=A0A0N4ZG10_PARTI
MVCFIILLLNILSITLANVNNEENFWIVSEIQSINFRKGCLKLTRCAEPRFQLNFVSSENQISNKIDTLIDKNMEVKSKMKFSKFFEAKYTSSLDLSSSILGMDPIFNIAVECDISSEVSIFKQQSQFNTYYIEVAGKCFSAVIQIKKIYQECEWCTGKQGTSEATTLINDSSNSTYVNTLIVVLSLLLVIIFCILSSILIVLLMKDGIRGRLSSSLGRREIVEDLNDVKVEPYMITDYKKRQKVINSCRPKKILSTIYESDDETPKRIPLFMRNDNKNTMSSNQTSVLQTLKIGDSKVNNWMEAGYIRTSTNINPAISYSSQADSGMPSSGLNNKLSTPSECDTSLFGGAVGHDDGVYMDAQKLRV